MHGSASAGTSGRAGHLVDRHPTLSPEPPPTRARATGRGRLCRPGAKLDTIFSEEMLADGYRKKYLRATSRLFALTAAGVSEAPEP